VTEISGLRAAQHLAQETVQSAQFALERIVALLLLVVRRRAFVRVPRGVHERALLRDKQQDNEEPVQETAPAHAAALRSAQKRAVREPHGLPHKPTPSQRCIGLAAGFLSPIKRTKIWRHFLQFAQATPAIPLLHIGTTTRRPARHDDSLCAAMRAA
jgi:hypothetical protein